MHNNIFSYIYILIFLPLTLLYVYLIKLKFNKLIADSQKGIYNNYIYYEADDYKT